MKKKNSLILVAFLVASMMLIGACGNTGGDAPGSSASAPPSAAPVDVGSADAGSSATGGSSDVGDVANDPVVELTVAHAGAPGSVVDKLWNNYGEAIERESGGSIKVNMFGATSLIQMTEYYDALSEGRVDMLDLQTSYFSSYMPELQVLEVPGVYQAGSTVESFEALKTLKKPMDDIAMKYGFKFTAIFPTDQQTFVGSQVIADPTTDLNGKTVRVSGKWNGRGVEEWGGGPVNMAVTEVSTALERKTVDMVLTTWIAIDGFKFYESAPHVTLTGIQEIPGGALMNLDSWNKLTDNQKAALDRAAVGYEDEGLVIVQESKEAFLKTMETEGIEVLDSSAEANAYYREVAWKIVDEEIAPNASDLGKALIEACKAPALQGN